MGNTNITKTERFDDVGPQDAGGLSQYAYHGFNYDIRVQDRVFRVRTYDHEPGVGTVISPSDARTRPEARDLVEFIASTLGCGVIQFYCGSIGAYRPVDIRTLEFTST